MNLTLYDFRKRHNSLKDPSGVTGTNLVCSLKNSTSIYNPTFIINVFSNNFKYAKWDDRYYFVTDIIFVRDHYYEVVCEIDVLATYKGDVLNTHAYVEYSASTFNPNIIDTRLSTVDRPRYTTTSAQLITYPSIFLGTFILSYVTDLPTYGASGVVWLDSLGASAIAKMLNSEGFNAFLTQFERQLGGAYESLISCKFVPMSLVAGFPEVTSSSIHLGGYDTKLTGYVPLRTCKYTTTLNIPWQYSDFRNTSPFTSILVFLPSYGFVDLNPNDLVGMSSLNITLYLDGITGEGTYIINNIFKCTCSFANDISIGTIKSNVGAIVSGGLSMVNTIPYMAMGGAVGLVGSSISMATTAIHGLISSQQRSLGNSGNNGGGSAVTATIGDSFSKVYCIVISHDTNEPPASFALTNGRPIRQNLLLSTLNGYCKTANASVAGPNAPISAKINSLLDGGVFIE